MTFWWGPPWCVNAGTSSQLHQSNGSAWIEGTYRLCRMSQFFEFFFIMASVITHVNLDSCMFWSRRINNNQDIPTEDAWKLVSGRVRFHACVFLWRSSHIYWSVHSINSCRINLLLIFYSIYNLHRTSRFAQGGGHTNLCENCCQEVPFNLLHCPFRPLAEVWLSATVTAYSYSFMDARQGRARIRPSGRACSYS